MSKLSNNINDRKVVSKTVNTTVGSDVTSSANASFRQSINGQSSNGGQRTVKRTLKKPSSDSAVNNLPIKEQIDLLNKRAFQLRRENVARSMLLAQRAYDLSSKGENTTQNYQKGLTESLLSLGYGHLYRCDYHLALTNAIEAQSYCETDEHLCDCYMLLGISHGGLGTYDKALKHLLKAMHLAENNESLQGDILAQLGKVYSHFGESDEALRSLKEALSIKQKSNARQDKVAVSETWNSLARVYLQLGYNRQALVAAQRSLDLAKNLQGASVEAEPNISCGLIYLALDDFDLAIQHLTAALGIARTHENRLAKLHALRGISEVYLVQGDYHLAEEFAKDALKVADFLDSSAEQYECHKLCAELYEAKKDLGQALEHQKRAQDFKDKVFDIKLDQHIRTVKLMHESQAAKDKAEIYQLRHVELQKQYDELKSLNARVSWLSHHDELTGLFNRRYFNEQLELAFGRYKRYENTFCVAMIDVEQLMLINQRYSQAVGDAVLQKVAATVEKAIRDVDLVARYGADEFMILFPELRIEQAIVACQRIQSYIKTMDWLTVVEESIEDNSLPIPVSINMAILPCDGIDSIESMVLKLDKQLQARKKKA